MDQLASPKHSLIKKSQSQRPEPGLAQARELQQAPQPLTKWLAADEVECQVAAAGGVFANACEWLALGWDNLDQDFIALTAASVPCCNETGTVRRLCSAKC